MTRARALVRKAPPVLIEGGDLWTTSLIMAERFEMQHKNLLQAIENLNGGEEFTRLNFQPSEYTDSTGRKLKMYRISEAGFMRLAFRFNSKRLGPIQDWFVSEFFRMRKMLARIQRQQATTEWQLARLEGKQARKQLTDTTQRFVDYAKAQDSKGANWYFKHITLAEHKALFYMTETGLPLRETLTPHQLSALSVLEGVVDKELEAGMAAGLPYKAIFENAKAKMALYGTIVGQSVPGDDPRALAA